MPSPSLLSELKRRSVFKVAGVYVAASFAVLQGVDLAVEPLHLPSWTMTLLWVLVLAGFPLAVVLAWAYELTPEGMRRTESLEAVPTARRVRTSVGFALGLLVALSGAYVLARREPGTITGEKTAAAASAPAPEGHAAGGLRPHLVAVAPLVNQTGDTTLAPLGAMAADWITRGLTETRVAEVADFSPEAQPVRGAASLRALAMQTGAEIVVSGSYYREGTDVLVVARITDAATGRVLREIGPVRGKRDEPLAAVERLRSLVAGALAVQSDPASPLEYARWGEPPAYEAYQAYLEGRAAASRLDSRAARAGFLRALSLDSTFAPAAVGLAWQYTTVDNDCTRVDSIAGALELRRERVEEYDRLEAEMYAARCRGDRESAYRTAKRLVQLSPGSDLARATLAAAAGRSGRLQEAAAGYRRLDFGRGWLSTHALYFTDYLKVLHLLGRYDEELRAAEQARRQYPDVSYRYRFGAPALAALGRTAELRSRVEELRRTGTPADGSVAVALTELATELAWHGHGAAARQFAAGALDEYGRVPAGQSTPRGRILRALDLILLERWTEARALLDSIPLNGNRRPSNSGARSIWTDDGFLLALRGIAAAKSGDAAEARAALAAIERLPDSAVGGYEPAREAYEAQVLAALGNREEALRRLEQGQRRGVLPPSDPQTTHADPLFRDLWHDPRFEALFAAR